MIRLCLHGASGRMGAAIEGLLDARFEVSARLDADSDRVAYDEALAAADVVIDFSVAAAMDRLVAALERTPRPRARSALKSGDQTIHGGGDAKIDDHVRSSQRLVVSHPVAVRVEPGADLKACVEQALDRCAHAPGCAVQAQADHASSSQRSRAALRRSVASASSETSGSRNRSSHHPSSAAADLTGIGLVVSNRALVSGRIEAKARCA